MKSILRYRTPAEDSVRGWEEESLPLGCGYFGANVFGIPVRERIQITENSLFRGITDGAGLENMAELYFSFPHETYTEYERRLILDGALAETEYTSGGNRYTRTLFTSYPDRCMVMYFTGDDRSLSFTAEPEIPFLGTYLRTPDDGMGKTGCVRSIGEDRILLSGNMNALDIDFAAALDVRTDGSIQNENGRIAVSGASFAELRFTCGTDYVLCEDVFTANGKKTDKTVDVPSVVTARLDALKATPYETLLARHKADVASHLGRVSLTLDGADMTPDTDEMLKAYRLGKRNPYLEMLYFQYGRYLLLSSSRPGTLPANLQGTWNCHKCSPWGSGYWHNINVQMNYWHAFSTNLAETFIAYADLNHAFRKAASIYAYQYLKQWNPEQITTDDPAAFADIYGWTVGTAVYPYLVTGPGGHSGPGTLGLTTKLFADWYDFTQDQTLLPAYIYPTLASAARFLSKTVRNYDGEYLASFSASPEQVAIGHWRGGAVNIYHQTVGCMFDQQMIWQNGADLLRIADEMGIEDHDTAVQKTQQAHLTPVLVGWSGQIKEFREENLYGEIGEYTHRHISQLVGLYPGSVINRQTPAWLDAARITLTERGDHSTGWALAHRLNAWARIGDGDHAYTLLSNLIGERTLPNLWDMHPPFQIDGNFGGTAGIAEMLLQSHDGYVRILPALPDAWETGEVRGLCARGGFTVSVAWEHKLPTEITVASNAGKPLLLAYPGIRRASAAVYQDGAWIPVSAEAYADDVLSLTTVCGGVYRITDIPYCRSAENPTALHYDRQTKTLSFTPATDGYVYHIYRAVDDDPVYTRIAEHITDSQWTDDFDILSAAHITYKVTALYPDGSGESSGILIVCNHASHLYLEQYAHKLRMLDT